MSVLMGEMEIRKQLMDNSDEYRRLAEEHQSYSEKLEELGSLHHLSDEERLEEITLKKKKLMLKDQMYLLLQKYREETKAVS